MPTVFANTIDGNDIYAKRAECDAAGNDLALTYATKGELPNGVPAVTSSDDSKVLTASYTGGVASYSWQPASGGSAGLFEAVYGNATLREIQAAIAAKNIVYCNVPVSGAGSGATRMAFLAYYNNSKAEFQYYRSVGTHTASQQGDQVFIYMVDSHDEWTTTTREAYTAIAAGTHMSQSYNNGTLTLNADWPTVDQTYDATSANAQSGVAVAGALATKQDTISDLATIRSGATEGATAVQPGDLATVATTGSYDDLVDKPTIPAAQVNSDWNSNSGVSQILNKPTLATVATTGDYDDLVNKPSIPAAQVNSDWNASSGVSEILNKPTIPTVPTAGNMLSVTNNVLDVTTTAGITDVQVVNALPASTVATVLYLIPET